MKLSSDNVPSRRLPRGAAIVLLALLVPASAFAQGVPDKGQRPADPPATQQPAPQAAAAKPATDAKPAAAAKAPQATFSVPVRVVTGGKNAKPLAHQPVILQAARPKGPFEPNDPKPQNEWTAVTDASGTATFANVPRSLEQSGLRLHAVTTQGGVTFKSAPKVPAPGIKLTVPVYELGHDTSHVVIEDLQTIANVWEDSIFFQQFYRITVDGDKAIDTSALPGKKYENGLPIELPTKALGIHASGPGKTKIVNSIVYWKGMLKPGEAVPVSISFSMKVTSPSLAYEQTVAYPTKNVKVVVPLESQSQQVKIPYFKDVSLAAPGFKVKVNDGNGATGAGRGAYLSADGRKLDRGQSFAFEVSGLPFDRPYGAWIALALGLLGAGFVLVYARGEKKRLDASHSSGELVAILSQEREELLDELAILEEDYEEGEVSDLEYERESLLLRERIALIMKKLRDLEERAA